MTPVWGNPDLVVPFVARLIGHPGSDFGECQTMTVLDSHGKVAAGIVFHNWNPDAGVIEVSAAAVDPRWPTRNVLQQAFGYVFAHCQLAVSRQHEDNIRARKLWKAFGADEYLIPRLRGRTASEAICTLTEEAWRDSKFMRSPNGQAQSSQAA